jgi:hypothetical protein
MYSINVDVLKRRVIVDFEGKIDANLPTSNQELFAACLRAKGGGDHFDILSDFTKSDLMSQGGADDSAQTVKWCLENGLRKGANVVGSALMRLQINRVSASDQIQNFATMEEAMAWLEE